MFAFTGTSYVNDLDSVAALQTLRLWVAHNPRFAGLQQALQQDEYSDGTLMVGLFLVVVSR